MYRAKICVLYLECLLTYALFPKKDEFKFSQRIAKISRCCHGAGKQNYKVLKEKQCNVMLHTLKSQIFT